MNNPFYGVACQTLFRFVDRQDLQIKPLNVPQLKGFAWRALWIGRQGSVRRGGQGKLIFMSAPQSTSSPEVSHLQIANHYRWSLLTAYCYTQGLLPKHKKKLAKLKGFYSSKKRLFQNIIGLYWLTAQLDFIRLTYLGAVSASLFCSNYFYFL